MSSALNNVFGNNILGLALNVASTFFPPAALLCSLSNMLIDAVGGAIKQAVDMLMQQSCMPKFIRDCVSDLVDQILPGQKQPSSPEVDDYTEGKYGDFMKQFSNDLATDLVEKTKESREELEAAGAGTAGGKSGGKSWLLALAQAFGKMADAKAKELTEMGKNINNENPSEMIEYQALTKEFDIMMQTFTNAIKTIGDANAAAVRK